MNRTVSSISEIGLLAGGCSSHWSIDIDQSLDGDELNMQIAGATLYLAFQLNNLSAVASMAEYLNQRPLTGSRETDEDANSESLSIGRFGSSNVLLRWDNEDFPRCFLVVGTRAQSTMHFNLFENDIRELLEILKQIRADLAT